MARRKCQSIWPCCTETEWPRGGKRAKVKGELHHCPSGGRHGLGLFLGQLPGSQFGRVCDALFAFAVPVGLAFA